MTESIERKEQRSFNALLPLEKQQESNDNNNNNKNNEQQEERQTTIANIARESSMIISQIQGSTPEIDPSVIPKCGINAITTTT